MKLIARDKKRRKLLMLHEKKRLILKGILANNNIDQSIRWNAGLTLSGLPKDSSKTKINNRCILTGRSRSIDRDFKISRICIRELGGSGCIPGLKKE